MEELGKFIKGKKRFFDALIKMFAFFAVVHILLAIILSMQRHDFSYINVFYIESASEFYPGIEKGFGNLIISTIIIAGVYYFFYRRVKK